MYFINNIGGDDAFTIRMRKKTLYNGLIFAVLFVAFVVVLLLQPGYRFVDNQFITEPNIYLHNLLSEKADLIFVGFSFCSCKGGV